MANKNNEVIGLEELSVYDALIKHYINLNYPKTNSNQIDDLFPIEPDPTEPVNPDPINPDPVQPAVLPNVSFGDATEEQFATIINGYYNGDFTLNQIQSIWHVGDTRSIDISAIPAEYVGESHKAQTITIRIIDFDHDELTTPINNKTKALLTVDLVNCLRAEGISDDEGSINSENGYMTPANSSERGWIASARREWCNYTFYNALPNYIKYLVKTVNKSTETFRENSVLPPLGQESEYVNPNTQDITEDKVFLLAPAEMMYGDEFNSHDSSSYTSSHDGSLYQYFNNEYGQIKCKLPRWDSTSNSCIYWTRSMAWIESPQSFIATGSFSGGYHFKSFTAESNYGIAPAFCL